MPPRSLTRTFVDATKLMHRKKSSSFEVVWSSAVAQWLIRDRGLRLRASPASLRFDVKNQIQQPIYVVEKRRKINYFDKYSLTG